MASEIGKIVHCVICGAPIVAKGNRLFCEECYNQNRRNAAQRSNARSKMEREQRKREVEKMKQNNKTVTADELSDRPLIAKISQYTDNSYIGIAGLKGGFGDIAASLDTLTQNTVRTGDDIQGLLDEAESSISGYLDEYAE